MFLKTVMERNQPLVRLGIEWQQNGVILPDTYLLDYDTILENGRYLGLTVLASVPLREGEERTKPGHHGNGENTKSRKRRKKA